MKIEDLRVKLFADGADLAGMLQLARYPYVKGFTTNPTLMRKAGVSDYQQFAREVLAHITDRPVSFEVFSDELDEMLRQARLINQWGANVYVKIPVTNTRHESTYEIVHILSHEGVKINVTAMLTLNQVRRMVEAVRGGAPSFISIFAGRIADTGVDPIPMLSKALELLRDCPSAELLWASTREILNVIQADQIGCHIITVTNDMLAKIACLGKNLDEFSLDTVKMFRSDALKAGYTL